VDAASDASVTAWTSVWLKPAEAKGFSLHHLESRTLVIPELTLALPEGEKWKEEEGSKTYKLLYSKTIMAEREGFEPPVTQAPQLISSKLSGSSPRITQDNIPFIFSVLHALPHLTSSLQIT